MVDPTTSQIGLMAPEDWFDIDIDPATSERSIRELCERQAEGTDVDPAVRAELEATLRFVSARCAELGAVAAMGFAEVIDEEPYFLTASLTIAIVDTDAAVSVSDIERELGARGYELAAVALPAGPAMVATGTSMESMPGVDEQIEVYSQRYYLPLGDDGGIAVLSFTTPTMPLVEEFAELFEVIAETLHVDIDVAAGTEPDAAS